MRGRGARLAFAAAIIAVLPAAGLWHREHEALDTLRAQVVAGELQPIASLLKENQALRQELQSEPCAEKGCGILEPYLANIRRDGIARHADMKQRLDILADNNTAIVTLIKAYTPHARTPGFTIEADKFRNYASAWRDRWNSVMELFMAGGDFAASEVPLPPGFQEAVRMELSAGSPSL
jgi:hypothetical protein